jgi:hypothetical protein
MERMIEVGEKNCIGTENKQITLGGIRHKGK